MEYVLSERPLPDLPKLVIRQILGYTPFPDQCRLRFVSSGFNALMPLDTLDCDEEFQGSPLQSVAHKIIPVFGARFKTLSSNYGRGLFVPEDRELQHGVSSVILSTVTRCCPNLGCLHIPNDQIPLGSVASFRFLSSLEIGSFAENVEAVVNAEALRVLSGLKNFQVHDLYLIPARVIWSYGCMPALRKCQISAVAGGDDAVESLTQVDIADIRRNLVGLVELKVGVGYPRLSGKGFFPQLARLHHLQKLVLWGCDLTGLHSLPPRLVSLEIKDCIHIGEASAVTDLEHLENLIVFCTQGQVVHMDLWLEAVSPNAPLAKFILAGAFFKEHPDTLNVILERNYPIRTLCLRIGPRGPNIPRHFLNSEAVIAFAAARPGLRELDLWGNSSVNDDVLDALANLEELVALNLANTSCTLSGFQRFVELRRHKIAVGRSLFELTLWPNREYSNACINDDTSSAKIRII